MVVVDVTVISLVAWVEGTTVADGLLVSCIAVESKVSDDSAVVVVWMVVDMLIG